MDFSDFLPHLATCADDIALIRSMHTEAFNHHPGQLLMNTGVPAFGRPSMGSWLNYGLGSQSRDLPGYVVLTAGRGTSGGTSNWSSGFLPTTYAGVLFRNRGEPVLNLGNPAGLTDAMQRRTVETIAQLNALRRRVRRAAGRDPHPRVACIDSQSVKTAGGGAEVGTDGGKKVYGRKRHVLVDSLGWLIAVVVTAANVDDARAAQGVFAQVPGRAFPRLAVAFADGRYRSPTLDRWLRVHQRPYRIERIPR